MLVVFKSKVSGSITMLEEHAKLILDLFNRDTDKGIITAEETGWALNKLEHEIEKRSILEARETEQQEVLQNDIAENSQDQEQADRDKGHPVSFSARVYPFLEMLRRANKENCDIVWGV